MIPKNKKGNMMNVFLAFTIVAIVGIIFVSIVSDLVSQQTTLIPNNETDLKYNGSISITLNTLPINIIDTFVDNSSGVALVEGSNYTLTKVTGVIENSTGNVITNGTPATGYDIIYRSEPAGFVGGGINQTVLLIIPILFIVVYLIFLLMFRFGNKT